MLHLQSWRSGDTKDSDSSSESACQDALANAPSASAPPSRQRRRWLVAIACALLALAAGIAYRMLWPSPAVSYVTMPVTTGSVTRTVTATGGVNPVLTIVVGSYVSGVIRELHCDFNTRVEKGQVCAKIDPRPHQAAVDDANVSESDISSIREGNKASFSV